MIKKIILNWLNAITNENLLLFGAGPLNCARLGELNKRNTKFKFN